MVALAESHRLLKFRVISVHLTPITRTAIGPELAAISQWRSEVYAGKRTR